MVKVKLSIGYFINIVVIIFIIVSLSTDFWVVSKASTPINVSVDIDDDNLKNIVQPIIDDINNSSVNYDINVGLWNACFDIQYSDASVSDCINVEKLSDVEYIKNTVNNLLHNKINELLLRPIDKSIDEKIENLGEPDKSFILQVSKVKDTIKEEVNNNVNTIVEEVGSIIEDNGSTIKLVITIIKVIKALFISYAIILFIQSLHILFNYKEHIILTTISNLLLFVKFVIIIFIAIVYKKYEKYFKKYNIELDWSCILFITFVLIKILWLVVSYSRNKFSKSKKQTKYKFK